MSITWIVIPISVWPNPTRATGPLELLGRWLEDARGGRRSRSAGDDPGDRAADGRPSARLVSLKRLSGDALVFTTALWTRKVEELRDNPRVAATFYWPALGRQARVEGRAEIAERELAEELFAERPRSHQLQAHVSRQGEEIEGLDQLRGPARGAAGRAGGATRSPCPEDWGAVSDRPRPNRVLAGGRGPPAQPHPLRSRRRRLARIAARSVVGLPVRFMHSIAHKAHRNGAQTSSISVTGPSLTRATPMQAPKTPFLAPRRSQKRS